MTAGEIRAEVLAALGDIAPEADLASLRAEVGFREQLDVDSMDLLNFVVALHERLGVDIPEADYPKLSTLDRCVEYLAARTAAGREAGGA
ncbi:MAG: acyl carrier protein [Candidatus Rokubacteria bacterium]|nr:acyl carrier protein [Candidatus Rokubacteria bacterium]